jgi:hypothetical protein
MPSGDQNANRTWIAACLLALNLTALVCDLCPAAGASGKAPADAPLRRTAKTLRRLLFRVPASVSSSARQTILRLPAGYRHTSIISDTLPRRAEPARDLTVASATRTTTSPARQPDSATPHYSPDSAARPTNRSAPTETRPHTTPDPRRTPEIDSPQPQRALLTDLGQRLGYEIVQPITTESWGVRRFFVRAPDGNVINVVRHRD